MRTVEGQRTNAGPHIILSRNVIGAIVSSAKSSRVLADIHDHMAMWLTAGQADEWMAAEPDAAMAMLLANYSPVGTRIDRPEDRQAD